MNKNDKTKINKKLKLLFVLLAILATALGYVVFGLTSKCGNFEGKSCPRGFVCELTEKPGYVVKGGYDECVLGYPFN